MPPSTSKDSDGPPRPPRPGRSARPRRQSQPAKPNRLIETAGPDPATPLSAVRLTVGTVIGTHGLRGELKVRLATDDPEHLAKIKRVYLGDEPTPRRVVEFRLHAGFGLFWLKGIMTPEQAMLHRGEPLRIAGTDARPLEPGEYYLYQLIGLQVFDEAGTALGAVTDIMETGANDVLVVAPPDGGADQLFPNHPDVVLDVDPNAGRMVVRPLVYWE